jgi:uncharacterized membrane protein YfcA
MARSHHRKKHKSHLKQFRQSQETSAAPNTSGKAAWIIAIAGALAGFAITFFAAGGAIAWIVIVTLIGGVLGYFIGKKMDEDATS